MKINSYYQKPTTYLICIIGIILIIFYPKIVNNNIENPLSIILANPFFVLLISFLLCAMTQRIIIKEKKIILNIFFFIPIRKIKVENLRQMEQRSITLLCTTFDGNKSRIVMFPDVSNRERFLAELKEINSSIDANNIH